MINRKALMSCGRCLIWGGGGKGDFTALQCQNAECKVQAAFQDRIQYNKLRAHFGKFILVFLLSA